MRYFRFFSDAEGHDQTATWGHLTVLYEVDDDFGVQRQLNLYGMAPFVDRFDRSAPKCLGIEAPSRGDVKRLNRPGIGDCSFP